MLQAFLRIRQIYPHRIRKSLVKTSMNLSSLVNILSPSEHSPGGQRKEMTLEIGIHI